MKELFVFLWTSAPELVSLVGIIGFLVFISMKVTLFYAKFEAMDKRLTNVEDRLDRLEKKIDMVIEYLTQMKSASSGR